MIKLSDFGITAKRGFLPAHDPLSASIHFPTLKTVAQELPKLIACRQVSEWLKNFELPFPTENCIIEDYQYAARILSFLGHGYVWEDPQNPKDRIPENLAQPWVQVMSQLDRPPVLSYASYAMDNWCRLNNNEAIELGNIALLQNFLGGLDEEWFILIHVSIEAKAGEALDGIIEALQACSKNEIEKVVQALSKTASAQEQMNKTLTRMGERCDPYIYFNRVRPYIHGWKDSPALPNGVIYEGVAEFKQQPQKFRGETGAQSAIIPVLDAAFGVQHGDDPLVHYLREMRDYMPPKHRDFIHKLENIKTNDGRPLLLAYILDNKKKQNQLWQVFSDCINQLVRFRTIHYEYADQYIHKQSKKNSTNPTDVGTGGTPFMRYLKKHLEDTKELLKLH
ncbi:MAG: hypothetical protein V3V61_02070 [Gammaproteobacteria bacterium]